MDFLIKAYWYQAEARELGIKVTNAQVQQAFNTAKTQQFQTAAQFQSFLSQTGQTMQDILFRVPDQPDLPEAGRPSTRPRSPPATIQQYYQAHLSQFGTPATRNIRIVLTKTQGPGQRGQGGAGVRVRAGTWSPRSTPPTPTSKNHGGLLVGVTKGQEDAALDSAAFSATINKIGGPIQGQFGWYVYEVTKITKSTQQTLAQATPLIKQTLQGQQQTNAQTALDKHGQEALAEPDAAAAPATRWPTAPVTRRRRRRRTSTRADPDRPAHDPRPPRRERLRRRGPLRRRSSASGRSPGGCGPSARGIASRTSARSCPHTVEEAYELADAAQRGDDRKLLDELGDVLFQVYFLSLLLEERDAGSLAEVADHCSEKLIRRHPHVFGEASASTAAEVLRNWDQIKASEAGREPGVFGEIPENLPSLAVRAQGPAPGRDAADSTSPGSRGRSRRRARNSTSSSAPRRSGARSTSSATCCSRP